MHFSRKQKCCVGANASLLLMGLILVVLGLVIELVIVPIMIKEKAKKQVIIKTDPNGINGLNRFTNDWLHQNYSVYMQYWMYNYTNAQSIVDLGSKASMIEKGPYSYREIITYNYSLPSSFSNDGELFTYNRIRRYEFDQTMSCDDCYENDTFNLPNIIFFDLGDVLLDLEGLFKALFPEKLQKVLVKLGANFEDPKSIDSVIKKLGWFKNFSFLGLLQEISDVFGVITSTNGGGPFLPIKVHEILWDGYEDPAYFRLIKEINQIFAKLPPPLNISLSTKTPKVALNEKYNPSLEYTVNTGIQNYKKVGMMVQFNRSDVLPSGIHGSPNWWGGYNCSAACIQDYFTISENRGSTVAEYYDYTEECECTACTNETASKASNMTGTNGDLFNALIQKSDVLTTFSEDICRYFLYSDLLFSHLKMIYQKDTQVRGIDTYRFIIDPKSWAINEPDNCGYCHQLPRDMYGRHKGSYCLPNGLLDTSGCHALNTKIIISYPHFYGADPEVRKFFIDMKQGNEDDDQTTIDLLPTIGTALSANKRVQINYMVKNYPGTPFGAIPSSVYPFTWVNESFMMDDHTYQEIQDNVIRPQHLAKVLCYTLGVGLGAFLMVLSVILTIVEVYRFKNIK